MYHIQPGLARTPLEGLASIPRAFLSERERWPLWLPVLQGLGIAVYFSQRTEPPLWLGLAILGTAAVLALSARRRPWILLLTGAAATVAVGFAAAQWRTAWVAAPVLEKRLGPVTVTGRVRDLGAKPEGGARLTLDRLSIARLDAAATPARIRVTVRGSGPLPRVGDRVRLRAMLLPPAEPSAPGAFDFARKAYFERLGAVGYAFGGARVIPPPDGAEAGGAATWINALRRTISRRVQAALEGATGAIAAALMIGDVTAIPEDTMADFRDSGLAHLLAVSGLNFGLLAGVVFAAVRLGLAAVPGIALRYPIKKWAAVAALAGAVGYLLVTPPTPPTHRAFLMLTLVMLAVLVDRSPLSPRLVAWAAGLLLLLAPESLLSASFQMSFAAVIALIAVYEGLRGRLQAWRAKAGLARRMALYLGMVAMTSLIAGLATMPFALHHFNRVAFFGLAANMIAVPVTAVWIMPWAVAAFALMPVGAEAAALVPMGWGIDLVIATAAAVARWPGAAALVPATPTWALGAVALGGLWLCLWQGRWRWLGLGAILVAGAGMPGPPPDIWVDGDARVMAVRAPDGRLYIAPPRRARGYAPRVWLRRAGEAEAARDPDRLRCDVLGCVYRDARIAVAFALDPRAFRDDCRSADIVIAAVPLRSPCPSARLALDRFDLWRNGSYAIWLGAPGEPDRVRSAAEARGDRPWSRPPVNKAG